MKAVFLHKHQSAETMAWSGRLRDLGLWNVFNPSVLPLGDDHIIAFRAGHAPGDKPFSAFVLYPGGGDNALVDLGSRFRALDLPAVSDPKLFALAGRIFVTFNTGHFETPNRLFIAELWPKPGPAQEVKFEGRQEIEKNWSFLEHQGRRFAVYSIAPLVLLEADTWAESGDINFRSTGDRQAKPAFRTTQGTQFYQQAPDRYVAITHRKVQFRRKRLYLGQPAVLSFGTYEPSMRLLPTFLAHSPRAVLGSATKHNKNLLSCTYFAGFFLDAERAVLSYGINDCDFGFAQLDASSLGIGQATRKRGRMIGE